MNTTQQEQNINPELIEFKKVFDFVYDMVQAKAGIAPTSTQIDAILGATITLCKIEDE